MKLELKHIACYLPYELKVYHSAFMFRSNWNENELGVMVGVTDNIQNETFDIVMIRERDKYKLQDSRGHFKPVLRPLSDLTKEIEHNGEKINIFDRIEIYKGSGVDYLIEQIKLGLVEVIIFNLLLEYHFDVFGLLEQNLAIDINTI